MVTKMKMKAVFDCSADDAGELSFNEGDILVDVVNSGEDGWYSGRLENSSTIGLFPYNYVERIFEPADISQEELTKSPEPLSSSTNITIPTTSAKSTWAAGNKLVQPRSVNDNTQLPGFPALDAFEAAMSTGKSSKTTSSSWNASTISASSVPPVISPKPKLATTYNVNQNLGLKAVTPTTVSEKPQLKTFEIKGEASPTRLRSYSTSSVLNKDQSTDKMIKPSQLANGKNTKSALELALNKGTPNTRVQSKLRSNSFTKPNNSGGFIGGGVPLVGMANLKLNNSISNDVEEEDGYQMIKPSQLRQRQQQTSPKPILSKSSAPVSSFNKLSNTTTSTTTTATTTTNWKNNFDSNRKTLNNSPKKSTSIKLEDAPTSTSPMPRLPSRPVSNASRRSRNSRSTSLNSSPSTSTNTTPVTSSANLPSVKETTNEKTAPPILKPKPVISHPNLPPRPNNTKSRSSSNPPPLQPKPAAMSSIEILLSKNTTNENKPSSEVKTPPKVASNKPSLPLSQPKQINKSNVDTWKNLGSESSMDVNIKPSALLNRTRSSTNPTSNIDWSNAMTKRSNNSSSSLARPTSPVRSSETVKPEPKKKSTPPPPPPSRPPKNSTKTNHIMDDISRHRYEILFDTIHDDGYVDGETARFIWLKSKLSSEELSRIWKECDPDHKGLLDKHAFIDGMGRIDELLMNKQQQIVL